jgi:hypothetical protein
MKGSSKVRDGIPIFIPSFNNPTYVDNMVRQLRARGLHNLTIVDNRSTSETMIDYLKSASSSLNVDVLAQNFGPRHLYRAEERRARLPNLFCVTDPDLELNSDLPEDFLDELIACTERFAVGKAGFSLDISDPAALRDDVMTIGGRPYKIWEWEAQFWKNRLGFTSDGAPIYRASIDTTFALYNKRFYHNRLHFRAVRVAGNYTCKHLPWYRQRIVPHDEQAYYDRTSAHSFFQTDASHELGMRRKTRRPLLHMQRRLKAQIGLLGKIVRARLFP